MLRILCENFQLSPASISGDGQIKVEMQLKRASILLAHLLGYLETYSQAIFYGSQKIGVGNIYPCIYTSKVNLLEKRQIQRETQIGPEDTERIRDTDTQIG